MTYIPFSFSGACLVRAYILFISSDSPLSTPVSKEICSIAITETLSLETRSKRVYVKIVRLAAVCGDMS